MTDEQLKDALNPSPSPFKSKIWKKHGEKQRFELEWKIVLIVLKDLLAAGATLWIESEEEERTPIEAADMKAMETLFNYDDTTLHVRFPGRRTSSVIFYYGNSGHDVIHDYGTSLERHLKRAHEFADLYA